MLLGIDHLVIAVRDPDAAAAELERELGLAWTGGGRHVHAGTFNRLAFLGDTYLELIGVFDRQLVLSATTFAVGRAALAVLDAGREGFATWAIATDDIEADVARLQAAGSSITGTVGGARLRPDGGVVRWRTAYPSLGPAEPPFLIEHEHDGAEWDAAARAERATFRHPVGGRVRLSTLELPMPDPPTVAASYRATLGVSAGDDGTIMVGDHAVRLRPSDGAPPIVGLVAEPGSPSLDMVRYDVRWQRRR